MRSRCMQWRRGIGGQSTLQERQYQYEEIYYKVARADWCTRAYVSRTKGYGLICYGGAVVCCARAGSRCLRLRQEPCCGRRL